MRVYANGNILNGIRPGLQQKDVGKADFEFGLACHRGESA
jgi:hypothetical protein